MPNALQFQETNLIIILQEHLCGPALKMISTTPPLDTAADRLNSRQRRFDNGGLETRSKRVRHFEPMRSHGLVRVAFFSSREFLLAAPFVLLGSRAFQNLFRLASFCLETGPGLYLL